VRNILISGLLVVVAPLGAVAEAGQQTPKDRLLSLQKEYDAARKSASDGSKVTKEFAARFLELAEQSPADPASVEALTWVLEHCLFDPSSDKAVDLLIKHHLQRQQLALIVRFLAFYGGGAGEKLFRAAIETSRDPDTLAWAHFGLAQRLRQKAQQGKTSEAETNRLLREAEDHYDIVVAKHAAIQPPEEFMKRLAVGNGEVASKYGGIWPAGCSLGDMAKNELFVLRNLAIGKVAPDIEGEDIDGARFKLSDYRGKVVILDFWGHW
jgi:hypothetical protein